MLVLWEQTIFYVRYLEIALLSAGLHFPLERGRCFIQEVSSSAFHETKGFVQNSQWYASRLVFQTAILNDSKKADLYLSYQRIIGNTVWSFLGLGLFSIWPWSSGIGTPSWDLSRTDLRIGLLFESLIRPCLEQRATLTEVDSQRQRRRCHHNKPIDGLGWMQQYSWIDSAACITYLHHRSPSTIHYLAQITEPTYSSAYSIERNHHT